MKELLEIINSIRENKGEEPAENCTAATLLREELGFDSLDLAELTVKIEKKFKIDVFENGVINTVGEIINQIHG